MLNILRLRSCAWSRSGQISHSSVFLFWVLGSVGRTARRLHSPKALCTCLRRILHEYEGHAWKGQGLVTKGHYKIKVTNIPCNTSFLGHAARKYRWWQSFDPMTSYNLTFDGGQVKVRSNKVKISVGQSRYFCIKRTCFLLRISSGFQTCHYFSSTMRRAPKKNRKSKMTSIFRYILQIPFSYGSSVSFMVIAFWLRVTTKQCGQIHFQLRGRM